MILHIIHDTQRPEFLGLTEPVEIWLPGYGLVSVAASAEEPYWWNGNSTPPTPLLRYLVPKWYYLLASCVHDALCEAARTKAERKRADGIYRAILQEYYNKKLIAAIGYLGVRLGALLGRGTK